MLDPHLRRTQHVSGGMQRYPDAVHRNRLAEAQRLKIHRAEARAAHVFTVERYQIVFMARARVVAMRVGDHRALHWPPRIDIEITRGAIKPRRHQRYEVCSRHFDGWSSRATELVPPDPAKFLQTNAADAGGSTSRGTGRIVGGVLAWIKRRTRKHICGDCRNAVKRSALWPGSRDRTRPVPSGPCRRWITKGSALREFPPAADLE